MRHTNFLVGTAVTLAALASSPSARALDGTWYRSYFGGYGHSVLETADGGAILGATFGAGFECCKPWLIRVNPDGSVAWQFVYDAPGLAGANNVVPTRDGGYVLAGEGTSFMAVKVDASGAPVWARDFGEGGFATLRVLEAADGSLLLTGATTLEDDGGINGRAVLLGADGSVLWQKVYGRPGLREWFAASTEAHNGNFLAVGTSRGEYWAAELDRADGSVVWQNSYGGGAEDNALVVTRLPKKTYLVVGSSESFAEGGLRDWWAVIVGATGKVSKQFALGGFDAEDPHTAIATADGGFLIGGGTGSFGAGFSDVWLVKFDGRARIEWQKTYGLQSRTDHAWDVRETATGYAVIGDSYTFPFEYELWLMQIDRDGNVERGSCVATGDSAVAPRPPGAATRPAGASVYVTKLPAIDLEVTASEFPYPIESCTPEPTP